MDVVRVKAVFPARLRPALLMARSLSLTRNLTRTLHTSTLPALDRFVLDALSATPYVERPNLPQLIRQYLTHSGKVLGAQLAYESRPSSSRRVSFSDNNSCDIHLIAHVAREGDRNKVTLSSGFAIDSSDGQSVLVTCAHTLEEVRHIFRLFTRTYNNLQIRWSPLLVLPDVPHTSPLTSPPDLPHVRSSGSFIFSQRGPDFDSVTYPVASILSSLHRSDLILLSPSPVRSPLRSLPISPYPAPAGTPIRAHFVSEKRPEEDGWQPWIGGTWSKWVRGTVLGYRDFSGREATVSSPVCAAFGTHTLRRRNE